MPKHSEYCYKCFERAQCKIYDLIVIKHIITNHDNEYKKFHNNFYIF